MAHDCYQTVHRHHESINTKPSKFYHRPTTTNPLPPVPPAQPSLLQSAQQQQPGPVPTADPEAMPAKQSLNEWGAFTSGSYSSSGSGALGLGPLLSRHAGGGGGGSAANERGTPTPTPLTGRDLVEMDRVWRNDPVSFHPMQAIAWARLDEDVVEDGPPQKGKGEGQAATSRHESGHENVSDASAGGKSRQSRRDHHVAHTMATSSGGHSSASMTRNAVYWRAGAENAAPTPSPVGTVAHNFSNMAMAGSDGQFVFAPQTATAMVLSPPPPSTTTPRASFAQPRVRQQHKHRHRHEKKTTTTTTTKKKTKTGPSLPEMYMQQQPGYSSTPSSSLLVSSAAPPAQHPYPAPYQVTYTNDPTAVPPTPHASQDPPTALQKQPDFGLVLLLCLAPSCQARFFSETQLNAHYQAAHAAHQPAATHGGREQHMYSSSNNGLACSYSSCGAGGFTSQNALVWHVKAEHLLQCPVPGCCDRTFPSRKQLDGHVRKRAG